MMTAPFHMLRLQPDMPGLVRWAHARSLVGRSGDLSYALHAALAAAFGDDAPKPFRLVEKQTDTGAAGAPMLLGYSNADRQKLLAHAKSMDRDQADLAKILCLDGLALKAMPERWAVGARYHFEVRVRPIVRTDGDTGRKSVRERDAFLHACDQMGDGAADRVDRGVIYADWLSSRIEKSGGAHVIGAEQGRAGCTLAAFQRLRIARKNSARTLHEIEGPDAIMTGLLEVTNSDRFHDLLRRGIGRHRAFGYGMVLLKPSTNGG
ncbi:CRISPR-associated protein Cse3 [Iodidimonas nitroreducens]|uniref:CRISPR-associated protein Cse3 n=1 Tax=Iodidimonas nitroreducens TaxID=1236968 RepID=A0A5A7NB26_9PROT|nr:type I-E CRISPR-associated protein Cas6/Cse3/CasE [Iodidimonas nitroreducens]GAK34682.1 CRISPR-associated protein Cas6/Cse3/CasE, subtype I-E/ECOLI [alpha proteobacterium Q-1]GER05603.1 CRISPR-associated protein Cse3 [Iodidimonas nitroreducens]